MVYLSNIPAIATENLLAFLLFSLFTTCFGPYGPSSGEIQLHHLTYFEKAIDTTTDPLFYNCHSYGASLIIYFTIHIMVNEFLF
jgi:hypothetical protein